MKLAFKRMGQASAISRLRGSIKCLAAALVLLCCAAAPARAQAGTWQYVDPLPVGLGWAGAATGSDGRVYLLGGHDGWNYSAAVYAYDRRTGTWASVAPMTNRRANFGCVTGPDGRIYAIGGFQGYDLADPYAIRAEAFDTGANQWAPIASLPIDPSTEHVSSAAVGNDGRIYAMVGRHDGTPLPPYLVAYNIAANTWSPRIDPPVTLLQGGGVTSDARGRIYFAGGYPSDGTLGTAVFRFDALANTWESLAPLSTGHTDGVHLSPAGDGRIYAIGSDYDENAWVYYNTVEAYDPERDSWAAVAQPNAVHDLPAVTLGPDGSIYLLGGWDNNWDGYLVTQRLVEVYQAAGPNVTAASIQAIEKVAFSGVVASFTDPRSTNPANFSASIQWGDGQTSSGLITASGSGGFSVAGSHTYTVPGTVVIRIAVTAVDGTWGVSSAYASVKPQLSATGLNIVSGSGPYSGPVAEFTDLNPSAATAYTATIQWGDGGSSSGAIQVKAGGGFTVTGKHKFQPRRSSSRITVTITKAGVSPATAYTYITFVK